MFFRQKSEATEGFDVQDARSLHIPHQICILLHKFYMGIVDTARNQLTPLAADNRQALTSEKPTALRLSKMPGAPRSPSTTGLAVILTPPSTRL